MKSLSTIAFLLFLLPSLAQYDGKEPDKASRHRPGIMWYCTGWRPAGKNSAPKYDRLMIDLSTNNWSGDSVSFPAKPLSIGFNIHGMWDIPLTPGNAVGLGIGVSYRQQRMRFDGVLMRNEATQSTILQTGTKPGIDEHTVFGSNAFAIPVELRFRTPQWKHVKLHVGAHVGYYVKTFTKTREGDHQFVKDHRFDDNQRLFYGVHARMGVRNWALFADYSLVKQFSSDQSTGLHPISFGITCSLF